MRNAPDPVLSVELQGKIQQLAYQAFEPCNSFFELLEGCDTSGFKTKAAWWQVGQVGQILFEHGENELKRSLEELVKGAGEGVRS